MVDVGGDGQCQHNTCSRDVSVRALVLTLITMSTTMRRHTWAAEALKAQGLQFDTRRLCPARQSLPFGFVELHEQGILTLAWRRLPSTQWSYWRIYPDPVEATLTDLPYDGSIPNVDDDPRPSQVPHCDNPLPRDAAYTLHIAMRWVCRLHAHTPIGSWDDMHVANGVQQWFGDRAVYIRAMAIAYSAPPQQPPDFELRVYCVHQLDHAWQHDGVYIRIDRARKTVTVQHDQARATQQRRTIQTVGLARTQSMAETDITHAFDRWVLHQALRMHTCADTLLAQHAALRMAPDPPKPLSPDRRRELAVREKAWYMRRPGAWPLSRRAQPSTECREAAKQPRS